MEKRLSNKIALITGGGSGIGHSTAVLFAQHGAKVIIADINGFSGEKTVEQITTSGGHAQYINVHIARHSDCQEMIKTIEEEHGYLDVLFNNAGIIHRDDGDIQELDEKVWDMTLGVNVKGIYLTTKYALPLLLRAKNSSVINSSSYTALKGNADAKMAYTASKGAIIALTKDLAAQYASKGVRFNALCPGPVLTESFTKYFTEEEMQSYLKKIPLRRFADTQEIAKAALYLASEDSNYITGSNLVIDGGISSIIM